MSPDQIELFKNWQLPLPTRELHGTPDDIRGNLKSINPRNWRQQGDKLIAETDIGPLINFLPTNIQLQGTDEDGLPTFKKLMV